MSRNPRTGKVSRSGIAKILRTIVLIERGAMQPPRLPPRMRERTHRPTP